MTFKAYYIENSAEFEETIDRIKDTFPCFVDVETLEMDYFMVGIKARDEDLASIEEMLAPLV